MSNILISGLVNVETTLKVRQFPIEYYPIDYPFFGIRTDVSGVAYNVAKAAATLGDRVRLLSMTGSDFQAAYIRDALTGCGIGAACVRHFSENGNRVVFLYNKSEEEARDLSMETGAFAMQCDVSDVDALKATLAEAERVLAEEYPACASMELHLPDEKIRRVGQSVAAASLPKLR
jgi:sugar/nucleoside kinase (ribokinase family)